MIIFLTGFMASGKTTHGKKLAKILNYDFFDTDKCIEQQEQINISEIFQKEGEEYFRKVERKILRQLVDNNNDAVIATGGGTPCFYDNMEFMNQNGLTVFLKLDFKTIYNRLLHSKKIRPLANNILNKHQLHELYNFRLKFYEQSRIKIDALGIDGNKIYDYIKYYL
ncbi:MAG: shikimate kinase [Marinilabiliales bacterium]